MTGGWPAQEVRRAPRAMIASVNPLASAAGLQVLREGGNAVDAAIAAAAVMTICEPCSNGLGSDSFAILWDGNPVLGRPDINPGGIEMHLR